MLKAKELRWFDCNCMFGPAGQGSLFCFENPQQLETSLEEQGIGEALLFSSLAKLNDPQLGNSLLLEAVAGRAGLHPCLTLTPEMELEEGFPERLLAPVKSGAARACRVFPKAGSYELEPWIMPQTFSALNRARIPLLVDQDTVHWDDPFDWDQVHRLCLEYRDLPVIVVRQGMLAARNLFPLLKRHENLYLETSYFQLAGGLEEAAKRFGAVKLVFGTGMPVFDPRLPIAGLLYSPLSDREKEMVAGENLRALLAAAQGESL